MVQQYLDDAGGSYFQRTYTKTWTAMHLQLKTISCICVLVYVICLCVCDCRYMETSDDSALVFETEPLTDLEFTDQAGLASQ